MFTNQMPDSNLIIMDW